MNTFIICRSEELSAAASLAAQTAEICPAPRLWVLGGLKGFPAEKTGAALVCEVLFENPTALSEPMCCAKALQELFGADTPELIITVSSPLGDELAAQLSLALDRGCVLGARSVCVSDGGFSVEKSVYAGNRRGEFFSAAPLCVSLMPDGSTPKPTRPEVISERTRISLPQWLTEVSFTPDEKVSALGDAKIVVAAGRGMGKRDNYKKLSALCGRLGAALGGSRPVICDGKLPADSLIGMSGQRISPEVCIVFGASGAAAFRAGVEKSRILIAVNKDPDAPIFEDCDFGVIADCGIFADALYTKLDKNETIEE